MNYVIINSAGHFADIRLSGELNGFVSEYPDASIWHSERSARNAFNALVRRMTPNVETLKLIENYGMDNETTIATKGLIREISR